MEKHKERDTSWWINDPLMKSHVNENAYLYIDTFLKKSNSNNQTKSVKYKYSHNRYLDLLHGDFIYVNIDDVDEFEKSNNVIVIDRPLGSSDIRKITMQFADICFYWMQPASIAVDYINKNYEEENKPLVKQVLEEEVKEDIDDIKQYKLRRSELNARRMG